MLKIGFAFNFNIQRCEIEVGEEKQIIETGYKPLIELFKKHGMKANCFVSGYTSELIEKFDPEFLKTLKDAKGKTVNFGTYTYTHPIPQLLIKEEFKKQVQVGMEFDKKYLDTDTKGFLPPEFAFSQEMAEVLQEEGIEWFIALASQLEKGFAAQSITRDPYAPCKIKVGDSSMIAVPAAYQLPETPARYLKLMMKGLLSVDEVIHGIELFHKAHPGKILLFKRDAETLFIDMFNSGFQKTYEVMDEFLGKLTALDFVKPVWIEEEIAEAKDMLEIEIPDYLGNTKIETFTEGAAKEVWDLTLKVRESILEAEKNGVSKEKTEAAWHYLLLSHNSDGRIGYWFSEWNPGEHKVAPSRRAFCFENLQAALKILE